MKNLLSLIVLLGIGFLANAQTTGPVMELKTTEVDFGTIEQGSDPVRYVEFKNTGKEPLVIKNARGSCGCTVPDWPKEPIMPGQTNKIKINYDTNRVGPINKSVTITTNETNDTKVLNVKGEVKAKAKEAEGVPTNKTGGMLTPKG